VPGRAEVAVRPGSEAAAPPGAELAGLPRELAISSPTAVPASTTPTATATVTTILRPGAAGTGGWGVPPESSRWCGRILAPIQRGWLCTRPTPTPGGLPAQLSGKSPSNSAMVPLIQSATAASKGQQPYR
jgi:hypothetical protein